MPKFRTLNPTRKRNCFPAKQKGKRTLGVLATYEVVQRWVTGYRATQREEDIEREIFDHAKRLRHLSGLEKLPAHKGLDAYLHLWKKAIEHTSCGVIDVQWAILASLCAVSDAWSAVILSSFSAVTVDSTMQAVTKMIDPKISSTTKLSQFMMQQ
jgi:hypothetical protein